jgi:hypothetical protein
MHLTKIDQIGVLYFKFDRPMMVPSNYQELDEYHLSQIL